MGVPTVDPRGGIAMPAGSGASILTRVGLDELIAPDPEAYLTAAADLAADPERSARLRGELRDRDAPVVRCAIRMASPDPWKGRVSGDLAGGGAKSSGRFHRHGRAPEETEIGWGKQRKGEAPFQTKRIESRHREVWMWPLKIKRAVAAHQAGQLDVAEAGYRRVLAVMPDHPDALHLSGRGGSPDR